MSIRAVFTICFGKILHRLVDFVVTEVIQTVMFVLTSQLLMLLLSLLLN